MEAFLDLSRSRPLTMAGAGRIPISEMKAYFDLTGISKDPEAVDLTLRFVQALDDVYLEYTLKKTGS